MGCANYPGKRDYRTQRHAPTIVAASRSPHKQIPKAADGPTANQCRPGLASLCSVPPSPAKTGICVTTVICVMEGRLSMQRDAKRCRLPKMCVTQMTLHDANDGGT